MMTEVNCTTNSTFEWIFLLGHKVMNDYVSRSHGIYRQIDRERTHMLFHIYIFNMSAPISN